MKVRGFGRSDQGRVRSLNQDRILVDAQSDGVSTFVVADGVGGHKHGEVASRMFVEEIRKEVGRDDEFAAYSAARDRELRDRLLARLRDIANAAGRAIFRRAESDPQFKSMSTTGTALVIVDNGAFVAHAGDSRAYLIRGEKVWRLTEDHTFATDVLKELLPKGVDPKKSPFARQLTRVFGRGPDVDVDTMFVGLEPGDRFVLSTDGLHRYLNGKQIMAMCREQPNGAAVVEALIRKANARGGRDNISVVVVDVDDDKKHHDSTTVMNLDKHLALLTDVFLFRGLAPRELLRLTRSLYPEQHEAGTVIIRESEPGDRFYIVGEGMVEVSLEGQHLCQIGPGGHFGEMALLENIPRSATVVARSKVVLLTMDRPDFERLMRDDLALSNRLLWAFLQDVSGRCRRMSVDVKNLNKHILDLG